MAENYPIQEEPTAVDDVRRVREELDRVSGGDMRKHIEATNAAFEKLRVKLNLKMVTKAPNSPPSTTMAQG